MKIFQHCIVIGLKGGVAAVVAAFALTGCATVDLGLDTEAPRVRMPGDVSVAPVPPPQYAPPAQTMPVAPGGPLTQPLSPPGSADNGANAPGAPGDASSAPGADAHLVTMTTRADGASMVPPTPSNGSAQIDLLYDSSTRLLRWKAQWTELSSPITGVQFYGPAEQGQQGPPTLIWPGPFGPRYEGRATITPQQATDLMGGLWYLSITTANYPGGEIRGQLRVVY
jgi:hypothetical protein